MKALSSEFEDNAFQSTLPRRERRRRTFYFSVRNKISIHAPTKGATFKLIKVYIINSYFNPRSHEGSDFSQPGQTFAWRQFQSTLPRRERRYYNGRDRLFCTFQSTLPRRERPAGSIAEQLTHGFQSTLPRRERQSSSS